MRPKGDQPTTLSERQARTLFEAAPDAVVVVDRQGLIVSINAQAETLFGYARRELEGERVEILVPARQREAHDRHRSNFSEAPGVRPMGAGLDLKARRRDGSEFPVEISLSPVEIDGRLLVSSAIRDVSERHRIEAELREAKRIADEASRSKSAFLAAASHDLRQPLQAARLYAEVLRGEIDDPPETLVKLGYCLDSLSELLDKLLDISRLDSGAIEVSRVDFPLSPLIGRLSDRFAPLAEEAGLAFEAPLPGDLAAHSDPFLVDQILQNLLANAIRYTEKGRVSVVCEQAAAEVRIRVSDTGVGIAQEDWERVFEEFVQIGNEARDRTKGVGLGLAIVRRIAGLLGISVRVESRLGEGSVFTIALPEAAEVAETEDDQEAQAVEVRGRRLLVVDDDREVREALEVALVAAGFDVATASGFDEALSLVGDPGRRAPEGLIVDYRLDDRRNGVELVSQLREALGTRTPALVLTGDTSLALLEAEGRERGFSVLHKPATVQDLRRFLARELG